MRPAAKREKIRWRDTLCLLGNTIVGSIEQHFAEAKCWFAYGCDIDWNDVNLGTHRTQAQAKRAVRSWVEERI